MAKFFSLIAAALLAVIVFAHESSGTCPGGVENGKRVNQGRYWYECQDSQLVPKGCLTEDRDPRQIEIGGTFDTDQYRMQCVKGSDGFLTIVIKACVSKGTEHDVGSQWDDGTAFYTCVKEGNNARVITLGCVDQGRPLKIDDRVAKGDFIYQCRKSSDGTPTLNKVGCVVDGQKYNIGETIASSDSWYTCTDSGAKVVGCMYGGNKLKWHDTYDSGDVRFICKVADNKGHFAAFACLQHDGGAVIERKIGCSWTEGDTEYTCRDDGDKATKVPTRKL